MNIRLSAVKWTSIVLAVLITSATVRGQEQLIDVEEYMETELLAELPVGITSFGGA